MSDEDVFAEMAGILYESHDKVLAAFNGDEFVYGLAIKPYRDKLVSVCPDLDALPDGDKPTLILNALAQAATAVRMTAGEPFEVHLYTAAACSLITEWMKADGAA